MAHFQYKKENEKGYFHDMMWNGFKPFLFIVICAILIFLMLLVGSKNPLPYILILIFIVILAVSTTVIISKGIKKCLREIFKSADENGNVNGIVYKENNDIVIEITSRKTVNRIPVYLLKQITICDYCIFVKGTNNITYTLPRSAEAIQFFAQFMKK